MRYFVGLVGYQPIKGPRVHRLWAWPQYGFRCAVPAFELSQTFPTTVLILLYSTFLDFGIVFVSCHWSSSSAERVFRNVCQFAVLLRNTASQEMYNFAVAEGRPLCFLSLPRCAQDRHDSTGGPSGRLWWHDYSVCIFCPIFILFLS